MPMVAIWITIIGIGWGVYLKLYPPISDSERRRYGIAFLLCILVFIGYVFYVTKYNARIDQQIIKFINEGAALREECITQEEKKDLIPKANDWNNRMLNYLDSVKHSYASRVNTVTGQGFDLAIHFDIPKVNEDAWRFLDLRIRMLNKILKERN